jgi:hypothetical protein
MLAYFERDDVSPLLPPPAPLIAPEVAARRTLVSCLRAADEVPSDAFWEGRFERLSTPRRAYSGREDSPLVVARLHYDPESNVREGSVIRLHGDGRRWVVLSAEVTLHVIAYDRRHPAQRRGVPRERVAEHVHYAYDVFDTTKLLSPRKGGQPPYGGTMLLERPSHPGRASRVLPDEAARAMGIDITGIAEHDVQHVVGDGVTDVYKMQAAARIMERATMLHKVLHERAHAASVAAPLLAAPASPPLRHPTAGPNAPPLSCYNKMMSRPSVNNRANLLRVTARVK